MLLDALLNVIWIIFAPDHYTLVLSFALRRKGEPGVPEQRECPVYVAHFGGLLRMACRSNIHWEFLMRQ